MADCCQSSLSSLSWNHAQHLTNRFGKFAVKACGARMWQNSLFTLNVNDETTVYTAATVLSWPCLMFQSRDLSTCMFYFCLLILRCILFFVSTLANISKITLAYTQSCNAGCQVKRSIRQAKATMELAQRQSSTWAHHTPMEMWHTQGNGKTEINNEHTACARIRPNPSTKWALFAKW